jgi:hypothetical protein
LILALLLTAAQAARAPDDDRVYRIGGETHVLGVRLQSDYFSNPSNRVRLVGQDFEAACVAHFLAQRRIEQAYAEALRPIVIAAVRAVVPADRLATAETRSLLIGPGLTAWKGRYYDEIERRAGDLLVRASADHQRLAEELMDTPVAWPEVGEGPDRSNANAPQLVIACATYFGENREAIRAMEQVGETD